MTFDLMKLLDVYIWDRENCSFHDSLYKVEQFETIFIEIGAFWEFDPLFKDFEKFIDPWRNSPIYQKTYVVRINRNWLFLLPGISGLIWYAFKFFQILFYRDVAYGP